MRIRSRIGIYLHDATTFHVIFLQFNRVFSHPSKFNLDIRLGTRLPSYGYRITRHFPLPGPAGNGRKQQRLKLILSIRPVSVFTASRGFNLFSRLRVDMYTRIGGRSPRQGKFRFLKEMLSIINFRFQFVHNTYDYSKILRLSIQLSFLLQLSYF